MAGPRWVLVVLLALGLLGGGGCSPSDDPATRDNDEREALAPAKAEPGSGASANEPAKPDPSTPTQRLDPVAYDVSFDNEGFSAIWGSSDTDVWVFGGAVVATSPVPSEPVPLLVPCDVGTPPPMRATILRYFDGRQWTRIDPGKTHGLRDAHGSDREHVWAVGDASVVRLNGGKWVEEDVTEALLHNPHDPCHEEASLHSVWALSPTDVWAAGYIYPSDQGPGLIIHFDGKRWKRQPTDANDGFFGIWASAPDDAWAVGSSGLVYHYDGARWSRVDAGTNEYLWTVWGSSKSDIWTTGNVGTRMHFDGTNWHANPFSDSREIRALSGSSRSDVWAVTIAQDFRARGQALMHWDGAHWTSTPVGGGERIEGLWTSPAGKLWSAGSRIARRN